MPPVKNKKKSLKKKKVISKEKSNDKDNTKTKTKAKSLRVSGVVADSSKCSPKSFQEKYTKNGTCFSKEALSKIANAYNKEYSDQEKIQIKKSKSAKEIWIEIAKRMRDNCKDESCWVDQDFVKKHNPANNVAELQETFKPKKPESWNSNRNQWLTTTDIESVLLQYEDFYPDFKFIGPVPIDFDKKEGPGQCIVNELCNINVKRLLSDKISQIGIVFNLDPHDKSGSHWVAMFANLKDRSDGKKGVHKSQKPSIHYFDSYGMEPPKEILTLMRRIRFQAHKIGIKMRIFQSSYRHQYQNSECGVYSIFFITQMLAGKDLHKINREHHSDSKMTRKRDIFFR